MKEEKYLIRQVEDVWYKFKKVKWNSIDRIT